MPRTPHRSGPSGQHRRVEGPALAQQREQMRTDVLAALDLSDNPTVLAAWRDAHPDPDEE